MSWSRCGLGVGVACGYRTPFLVEHNLDAIVCFDNQHANVFGVTQRDYSIQFVNVQVRRLIIINDDS